MMELRPLGSRRLRGQITTLPSQSRSRQATRNYPGPKPVELPGHSGFWMPPTNSTLMHPRKCFTTGKKEARGEKECGESSADLSSCCQILGNGVGILSTSEPSTHPLGPPPPTEPTAQRPQSKSPPKA
ncbi:hypothetical protein ACJZ2D_008019 [Fusarium nematophilum]